MVVMCYAKNMGLTSNNHLWILLGWYSNEWWITADSTDWSQYKYNCTSQDIIEAIKYSIAVDYYTYPTNPDATSISGYVSTIYYCEHYMYDNNNKHYTCIFNYPCIIISKINTKIGYHSNSNINLHVALPIIIDLQTMLQL